MLGIGNFGSVTDTFNVQRSYMDNAPSFDQLPRAGVHWTINNSDTSYISESDFVQLDNLCQNTAQLNLNISR